MTSPRSVSTRSVLRRLILAGSTALLLCLALVTLPAASATAAGGSATDWMHHGKFGVMTHYLAEGCPGDNRYDPPHGCRYTQNPNGLPPPAEWDARVDNYDVEGVVKQLKSVGAGWLQISVGQNTGYFAAPNATYEALVPPTADHPSRLSDRDLIKDLGAALHKEGIKLIVYLTSDALAYDTYARYQLGGTGHDTGRPNATYQANWLKVVKTWSQQWGTDVDGYWVDGSYWRDLAPFYDQMAANLRSGNPDALTSFNLGLGAPLDSATTESDFTPGEVAPQDRWPRPTPGRRIDNDGTQMQLRYLSAAQGDWGHPADQPLSYSDEEIIERTVGVVRVGGAVTWDVGHHRDTGRISDLAMGQLKKVGQAVRNIDGNLAIGKSATQSSTYATGATAERAIDGTTNGDFGYGSVTHTSESPLDSDPWWQVDLGSSQPVSSIKLWNGTDCCGNRLRDFYVFASDTPFTSNDPQVTRNQSGVWSSHQSAAVGTSLSLPVNRSARYIRVQLVGPDRPLSLAEVQVMG